MRHSGPLSSGWLMKGIRVISQPTSKPCNEPPGTMRSFEVLALPVSYGSPLQPPPLAIVDFMHVQQYACAGHLSPLCLKDGKRLIFVSSWPFANVFMLAFLLRLW